MGTGVDDTQNLKLPYILAAQAQKHVTHNEALRALDAIVQLAVLDRDLVAPPASPSNGDRFIVASGASGGWSGKDGQIAAWQDGAWAYFEPNDGWLAWVSDEDVLCVFDGVSWNLAGGGSSVSTNPTPLVGVNATADATNRLTVSSPASLFNHEGDDHRQKINKAAVGDTASQLYQTNFSGRAEIGLTGDDDFHFKVSPDGSTFHEAIVIDKDNGHVSFPSTALTENLLFNLFEDAGRFAGSPEAQGVSVGAYVAPTYLKSFNGSTLAAGDKFHNNNATYGGAGPALGPDADTLIQKLRSSSGGNIYRRYGPEFHILSTTAGSGVSVPLTIGAQTHYNLQHNSTVPMWVKSTVIYNVKCKSGRAAVAAYSSDTTDVYLDGVLQAAPFEVLPADGWKQIVINWDLDPQANTGYHSTFMRLYAQASSEVLMALPVLFPGKVKPITGQFFGVVASLRGWR